MWDRAGLLAATLAAFVLIGGSPAEAQNERQELIDRAAAVFGDMASDDSMKYIRKNLKSAKAIMIFPSLLKAAFIFGAEGGNGILLARDKDGVWSDPAFYTLGSASFGFQIGVQDSEVLMAIMTERGLDAVISNNAKLGIDASIALGLVGGGLEGATTTAFSGDIAIFTNTAGLFGGLSLEGSVIYERDDHGEEYYGSADASARAIVIDRRFSRPGTEKLKNVIDAHTR